EDRGPGVPETFRSEIFGRFSQARFGTTRHTGGTGLGLSISKAIVERHDGVIGFESEEGRGSVFYFDLPSSSPGSGSDE
ncbi:ATP-binding protein, partial [Candidatus Poribacteria bacterium]|nr:ATP-binding protein [Candidatus Poribacteria bacterium]